MISNAYIYQQLNSEGVKHSLLGFRYLMKLLKLMSENPCRKKNLYDYYDEIAKIYDVKPTSVERAIRYSVSESGKTNKEFILQAFDDLLYKEA